MDVRWPDGRITHITKVAADRVYRLSPGERALTVLTAPR